MKKKKKKKKTISESEKKKIIYCSLKERGCTLTNNSYVGER